MREGGQSGRANVSKPLKYHKRFSIEYNNKVSSNNIDLLLITFTAVMNTIIGQCFYFPVKRFI